MHRINIRALFTTAAILASASSAAALTPAVLVDEQLELQPVTLLGLRDGRLTYFDAERAMQTRPLNELIQLRINDQAPAADVWGMATLTDGQRIAGNWTGGDEQSEAVLWQHRTLGGFRIPVDRLAFIARGGGQPPEPTGGEDRVALANGDVVSGFVIGFDEESVELVLTGSAQPVVLSREQIRAIRFANPPADSPAMDHVATLTDGTRLYSDQFEIKSDTLHFTSHLASLDAEAHHVPLAKVSQIELSAGGTLLDLADQPYETVDGGEVFGLPMPPRREGRTIHLHAPVSIGYGLRERASRFAATFSLDADPRLSEHVRQWADVQVTIRIGGQTQTHRLHRDQPHVHVSMPVTARDLVIELDSSANGPILDRVRMDNALVLLRGE